MSSQPCYIMNMNRMMANVSTANNDAKPPLPKEKVMSYEEKSVGSTAFFKCEACPYMALAEDDIKFHLFTAHPDLAKTNGLADNIQIPCPGCTSIFDAEETLRTHLRNHHKMGIKDAKKMVKSLVQIALKNAKLKKEEKKEEEPPPTVPIRQEVPDLKMPQVIEIIPDTANASSDPNGLPKGVAFISVDELQQMSTPNFEQVDPKEIIQEASINIVYSNGFSTKYVSVSDPSASSSTCNLIQMSSVPPDLISSIQPRASTVLDNPHAPQQALESTDTAQTQKPKRGRPMGSISISNYKDNEDIKEIDIEKKLGRVCSNISCRVRLKDPEKLAYHRKCHQNGNLQCPECNKLFPSIEALHTHLWKSHSQDMELPTCNICGFKTYKKNRLNNIHMKCHGPLQYPCPVCARQFKNKNQLSKHCMIHKKDKGAFQCQTCKKEFSTDRRMRLHIAAVHEKIRTFQCSHCEYTAARKGELKVHLRSHTGDKPYSCDKCSYRSSDHNSMRRHKKQHSKESTYKCKHCPYSTIQSTSFASHMISKHPNVNSSDVHLCPYCPYKTVSRDKYIIHLSNHPDKEGIQLLIEINKSAAKNAKPSWTIPSGKAEVTAAGAIETIEENKEANIPIEVYDCDSQQESMPQKYPKNYSTHQSNDAPKDFNNQGLVTDLSKDDNNSDCLISESSNDTVMERHQYPPQHHLPSIAYESTQKTLHFLNTTVEQSILQNSNVNSLAVSPSPSDAGNNIMSNFPIRLPLLPQISVRNNITLKPIDKISLGPIIKPTQILPVPLSSNSPVSTTLELEGAPRKKPKISVKSNLILKGPDQENMFHSQQKMAFKRLEDNERFGLGSPVTFNNLITTQFMQLPPEPSLSESPSNIMPYPQETMLDESATPPVDTTMADSSQIFSFNQQINVTSMSMLPPQPKIQTTDPSYIKLEGTIKQNNQSPSLERMCNANAILNNPAITREYKASPPLEDIHKNMSEIKNEVKSDFYNIPLSTPASNPPILDQYLIDNLMGEYSGHLDLSTVVMPVMPEDQQNDVIEIDDNSDDTKLLPRFDMNFPLESLYLMHNDFYSLDNEMPPSTMGVESVSEMNRMVTEVPVLSQKETVESSEGSNDFPNFIQGKKDPMMNTSVRPSTNKINVKNIELMKN